MNLNAITFFVCVRMSGGGEGGGEPMACVSNICSTLLVFLSSNLQLLGSVYASHVLGIIHICHFPHFQSDSHMK